MSQTQRRWAIMDTLHGSDKPLGIKIIAERVAKHQKRSATDKSFREMIARDLRDLKKITGAIQSKKVLISEDRIDGEKHIALGHLENAYSWKKDGPSLMVNALTSAQSVALGVLQKVALGLVPKALVDELAPLFTAVHKNELVKNQDEKDLGKKIPHKAALAAEEKWLNKIAILPETAGFVPPHSSPEVEKQIHDALYHEKSIAILYEGKEFVVKPVALIQQGIRRYLIGFQRHRNHPEHFTITRIKEVRESITNYDEGEGIKEFDLNSFLKQGVSGKPVNPQFRGLPINLKLWVDEGTYSWISETPLDASQTAKKVKDGYELSLTTTLREELVFWILSMANHVRVISPKVLKDRVANDLQAAVNLYAK